jgi:signal transduction histidine kinase
VGEERTSGAAGAARLDDALRFYSEGAFAGALEVVDEVLARDPQVAAAHYLRGLTLKDSGRDAEAAEAFDRALALDAGLERAYYHRGTARFLAGDKDGALRDLERAIEEEPDFVFAVYNLGVVAVAKRDWERAKRAFARCLELDPGNREEYVDLLVEIGRGEAQEESYAQGHRIKNLLGVVGDNYRTLQAELDDAGAPAPIRAEAARVAEELAHVYKDMVQFLRAVDATPPEVDLLDVRELVEKCLFALSPRLKNIGVERDFSPWVPDVIADRKSLAEALLNVLTNAIEACGARPDARVRITIKPVDAIVEVPGIDSVGIEVRDTGPGIAPEHLPRIFEFGYTTKRFGSGLGLSYADRVVRAHGGRIDVQSRPGEGAVVTLVLPASPVGAPNLRTLGLRSLLFEDLRGLAIRGGSGARERG